MWYALLEKYGLPVIEGIFFVETDFLSQIVEVIYENWDDNDDPELIAAIEGSLVDQRMKNVEPPEKEVDDVLRKFISDNLQTAGEDDFVNLLISRKNILSSTLWAIERKTFSFFKPVNVSSFLEKKLLMQVAPEESFFVY